MSGQEAKKVIEYAYGPVFREENIYIKRLGRKQQPRIQENLRRTRWIQV
jgi:hypothetical protein